MRDKLFFFNHGLDKLLFFLEFKRQIIFFPVMYWTWDKLFLLLKMSDKLFILKFTQPPPPLNIKWSSPKY